MRWSVLTLALLFVVLQGQLWLSDDGYRNTRALRVSLAIEINEQRALIARNAILEAEVENLKSGFEAAEERARSDLGLIGPREIFFQVVSTQADQRDDSL